MAARNGLALAPGKRTLTEGLQPGPHTGGGKERAAGPHGALLDPVGSPAAQRAPARGGDSDRGEGALRAVQLSRPPDRERTKSAGYVTADLAVGNDAGMHADAPTRSSLSGDTLLADGPWHSGLPSGEGGGVRPPVVGDVDTQCVGEAFARDLSDEALEQTIEYLVQRRDRTDLAPTAREVAIENLAVLAAESARRGRSSDALDRDAVRTLIRDATAGAQELAGILRQLAGNRDGLRNHPVTERFLEHAVDRLTWVVDTASASISYMELATSAGARWRQ